MSLADWQRDLAARVAAPRVAAGIAGDIDEPGLRLTRMLQRNWRYTRLTHALPLTMLALPAGARDELLADYCDACPCVSFFPVHEARGFADFLAGLRSRPPHVASIAALEVAMIDAFEAGVFDDGAAPRAGARGSLRLARGASRVRFAAPPEQVLAAALARRELPPAETADHELIVAPGIAGLARAPSADERRVLDACGDGRDAAELAEAATTLLAERVLVRMT